MALTYTGTTIGTLTLCQPVREKQGDQYVEKKDEKGRQVYNKFKIQLRQSNCMMCAIYVEKIDNPQNPKMCYRHSLVMFFSDEQHLKNCMKWHGGGGFFTGMFEGELTNIKLNVYYKENVTLMKYMVKDGLKVTCYYEEPKKK